MIGGDVDLDLLSLFPQEQARIIGGIESKQALRMSTMEVEQELNGWIKPRGEEDPLYIVGEGIRPLPPLSARAPAVLPLNRSGTTAAWRYYRWMQRYYR